MSMFALAPDVAKIAGELIRDVPEHKPLLGARIEYLFREKAGKSNGRRVLGTASKVGGRAAFLATDDQPTTLVEPEPFFVVEVAQDTWERLTPAQRRALIDHELCHLTVTFEGDLKLKGHDLEEFRGIVERHGFWMADVAQFSSTVAEQLALAIDGSVQFLESLGEKPDDEEPLS